MSEIEKKWLVKSNYKILGPFSYDQLEDILRKRQIALIDEVRDMDRRWSYIREIPELQRMAESIRVEIEQKSEATRTIQTAVSSPTSTSTKTEDVFLPDGTASVPVSFTDVEIEPQDISFKETLTPAKKTIESALKNLKKTGPQFGANKDPVILKQVEATKNKGFNLFLLGVVLLVMGGVGYFFYQKTAQDSYEKSLQVKLKKYAFLGLEQKVLDTYQKLPPRLQLKALGDIPQIIPKLQAEGLIRSEDVVEKLLNDPGINPNQKSELEVIGALQAMQIQDYKKAQASLVVAKNYDPSSEVVSENEAILDHLMMNFSEAEKKFNEAFRKNAKGRLLYGMALSQYHAPQFYTQAMEAIDRYTATRVDFKKHLLLMQIVFATKLENIKAAEYYFKDFIDTPIWLAQKFRTPSLVFRDFYSIDRASQLYLQIRSQLPVKLQLLVDMHLQLEKSDFIGAQKSYQLVVRNLTDDERANALIALESAQNHSAQLIAIEKANPKGAWNTFSQLALLQSKIQNSNLNVNAHYQSLQKERNVLSAWAGFLMIPNQDSARRRSYLQLNSPLSEDFIPFLEAKSELE